MFINQAVEAATFALHDSFEANFLPQYIVHPLFRGVRRHILNFRVTRHHPQASGFGNGADPGRHKILAQGTVRHLNGPPFEAACRFTLRGEIRQHRNDLVGGGDVIALRTSHDVLADAHIKVRVFGVGLLVSAHARVAIHLHHQRGKHVNPHRARLRGCCCVDCLDQIHVKGTAKGQALREYGCTGEHGAVRAFFVFHDRYLQARLGESDPLQLVEVFRLLACAFVQNLIGESEKSAARPNFLRVGSSRESLARLSFSRECLCPVHQHRHKAN